MQNLAGSAPFLPQGGTHFQLVPLGSPQGCFMGKFSPPGLPLSGECPDKHKVSAPNALHPKCSPLKKLKRLEKIDFQHTTITLGLVNK